MTQSNAPAQALKGVRVLDLTRILAGPWSTQILADLGAEVIKVERPGTGDDTRSWGPPNLVDSAGVDRGAAYFHSANRGKKSVAIDIGVKEGQDLVRELAAQCDLVVENFKVGGLARYGLDYTSLKAVKPDIVYCSITGFGQTGPYAPRAGYDFLVQAMGGLMSITGQPEGTPGGEPMKVGVALTDILTGLYATIGILAALRHRDLTGEGQHIDVALLDVQVATLANQALNFLTTNQAPGRLGNAHPSIVPYQAFKASNGYVILAIGNDGQFKRFCDVAGCTDLASDPRYATNPDRVRNRESLTQRLGGVMAARTMEDWIESLSATGVPVGPINDLQRVFQDPQIKARGLLVQPRTETGATTLGVASPLKLSATPPDSGRAAPSLGEHSAVVLQELLGLSPAEIVDLRVKGLLASSGVKLGSAAGEAAQ